jgi:hypothetical protein
MRRNAQVCGGFMSSRNASTRIQSRRHFSASSESRRAASASAVGSNTLRLGLIMSHTGSWGVEFGLRRIGESARLDQLLQTIS